jgi:glyoxylase-like metal-dependent hydrolase (beta-lactamase superfamily II)
MRFAIGDATVDIIVDDDNFTLPLSGYFPDRDVGLIETHRGVLEPDYLDLAGNLAKFAIQSFVLRIGGRTLLIDSCIGEHKNIPDIPSWHQRRDSGFLDRLRSAGVDPAAIDLVFCTHLHVDHVGWNTRRENDRWEPTFPNARYLFGRRELADWMAQYDAGRALPIHARALEQSVIPIVEAGRADLVDDGFELGPGLRLVPLPGHTRGQMGLTVDHGGERAIFCGDAVHNPLQIFQVGLSTSTCVDQNVAANTRLKIFAEAADSGRLVVPAHFRGSRCACVRAHGSDFEPVFSRRPM